MFLFINYRQNNQKKTPYIIISEYNPLMGDSGTSGASRSVNNRYGRGGQGG